MNYYPLNTYKTVLDRTVQNNQVVTPPAPPVPLPPQTSPPTTPQDETFLTVLGRIVLNKGPDTIPQEDLDYLFSSHIKDLPFINRLPASGRFSLYSGIDPWDVELDPNSYNSNTFFTPVNGSTNTSAGKFVNDNSTNGGTRDPINQTVQDLLLAMGRVQYDARYGAEFYVSEISAGSGTSNKKTVDGNDFYQMTENSNAAVISAGGYVTFCAWIRVTSGLVLLPEPSVIDSEAYHNYVLDPAEGWKFYRVTNSEANGVINDLPFFYGNSGASIQIAIPSLFAGDVPRSNYTMPQASFWEIDGNSTFSPALQAKLASIETGAEVNVQSDWNQTNPSNDSYIKNKPVIPASYSDLSGTSDDVTEGTINLYYDNERVNDTVAAMVLDGNGINIIYDDNNNKLNFSIETTFDGGTF